LTRAQGRPEIQAFLRFAQPNFFLPLDRSGINPFTQRFPVTLTLEGTVRGTGGIRLTDGSCATTVPGLYAAGDAATRQLICGGFTGGGSHNAAWAMSSGSWAGEGAARFARSLGEQHASRSVSGAGGAAAADPDAYIGGVQNEVFPLDKNLFRTESGLRSSLGTLDGLWRSLHHRAPQASARDAQRSREAAALVATARWAYASALERRETRGMISPRSIRCNSTIRSRADSTRSQSAPMPAHRPSRRANRRSRDDRTRFAIALRRMQYLRAGLPDQRVRRDAGRRAGHRAAKRLSDVLSLRGILPG